MNERKEFERYLKAIGITSKVFLDRIEIIYDMCCEMCPEEIEDVFVTNYINSQKQVEYENLWFFSPSYCLEAKQFLQKYDLDITPIKERIRYWTITVDNYDFKQATADSKLSLQFELVQGVEAFFKSEGKNCGFLKNIIDKYVKPNLVA